MYIAFNTESVKREYRLFVHIDGTCTARCQARWGGLDADFAPVVTMLFIIVIYYISNECSLTL